MSIQTFKTFLAVARYGTFTAAAKEIGLTQAAVSSQIRALENELKTTLFDRCGRSAVINSAGRNLIPRAAEVVSRYNDVVTSMCVGELGGTLNFGAIPPTLIQMLPDVLLRLKSIHPEVEVRVVNGISSQLMEKVVAGELDAALVAKPPTSQLSKALTWHPIVQEPVVLITPSETNFNSLKETLAQYPFIRLSRRTWTGRLIEQLLRRHNIQANDVMELDSLDAIREMVCRGLGVSLIPLQKGQWRHDARIRIWPVGNPSIFRTVGMIERSAHSRMRLTAVLLALLRKIQGASNRFS